MTTWSSSAIYASQYIEPRDRNATYERYRDPVTGAPLMRRVDAQDLIQSDSQGNAFPARCSIDCCELEGTPHAKCRHSCTTLRRVCENCCRPSCEHDGCHIPCVRHRRRRNSAARSTRSVASAAQLATPFTSVVATPYPTQPMMLCTPAPSQPHLPVPPQPPRSVLVRPQVLTAVQTPGQPTYLVQTPAPQPTYMVQTPAPQPQTILVRTPAPPQQQTILVQTPAPPPQQTLLVPTPVPQSHPNGVLVHGPPRPAYGPFVTNSAQPPVIIQNQTPPPFVLHTPAVSPSHHHQHRRSPSHHGHTMPSPPVPQPSQSNSTDLNSYWLWQSSQRNWQVPRTMPSGWQPPHGFRPPNGPSGRVPAGSLGGHQRRGSTSSSVSSVSSESSVASSSASSEPGSPVSQSRRSVTWVPHPIPDPNVPAPQFWGHVQQQAQPWIGPGGVAVPVNPAQLEPAFVEALTGGHPLPGSNPLWSPSAWVPAARPMRVGTVQIAPWLIANPRSSTSPHILWDANEHTTKIKRLTQRGNLINFASSPDFSTQATYPEANTVHVYIEKMMKGWGPVVVTRSRPVKVSDIFETVWEYLHTPMTVDEVDELCATRGGKARYEKVLYACWRRCNSASGLEEYERRQGFKRVDMLEGGTVFWGMYPCYKPDGTWFLSMAFCPPRSW